MRVLVLGKGGLIGRALCKRLQSEGGIELLAPSRSELDLLNQASVQSYFERNRPEKVFLAAAKMGGIYANANYRADFLYENAALTMNVFNACFKFGISKLIEFGCSSMYPKHTYQAKDPSDILQGALEPSNEPFALAKILATKLCEYYNEQYGTFFVPLIATNIYGPCKNFHEMSAPVIPALVAKIYRAKLSRDSQVFLWGSGEPVRDFLFVDDLVEAACLVDRSYQETKPINIGTGIEVSIRTVAETISSIVGYQGEIVFDGEGLVGVRSKLQELSPIKALGWKPRHSLEEGLKKTYQYFRESLL